MLQVLVIHLEQQGFLLIQYAKQQEQVILLFMIQQLMNYNIQLQV
jgi:hypothetical protein